MAITTFILLGLLGVIAAICASLLSFDELYMMFGEDLFTLLASSMCGGMYTGTAADKAKAINGYMKSERQTWATVMWMLAASCVIAVWVNQSSNKVTESKLERMGHPEPQPAPQPKSDPKTKPSELGKYVSDVAQNAPRAQIAAVPVQIAQPGGGSVPLSHANVYGGQVFGNGHNNTVTVHTASPVLTSVEADAAIAAIQRYRMEASRQFEASRLQL